ncbi:hypothetical protein DDE84_05945 [Bifidobacterium tibiigranuli]|jgi:hypothetical protein|uniref:Uncharacterized protein n=1 Tax=Bifidobacterium tibiigranuli TaxID=2172043 RepID=A0A5N6S4L4_9BIFI|nr:hypothetical protein DDE84_05945 [Bifidobacterium tibiigranuli]KAE8128560.1 hypothetical protein DDF78_05400 [Bifidobacterium tibiigranuli]
MIRFFNFYVSHLDAVSAIIGFFIFVIFAATFAKLAICPGSEKPKLSRILLIVSIGAIVAALLMIFTWLTAGLTLDGFFR